VGSDVAHERAEAVAARLEERGHAVVRVGALGGGEATPWPVVGDRVGRLVAQGAVATGIVCCWTGTGVSIAANKVPGVRAALCGAPEVARGARRWNDANVLALSLAASDVDINDIVDAWLDAGEPDPEEAENLARVDAMDRRYRQAGS